MANTPSNFRCARLFADRRPVERAEQSFRRQDGSLRAVTDNKQAVAGSKRLQIDLSWHDGDGLSRREQAADHPAHWSFDPWGPNASGDSYAECTVKIVWINLSELQSVDEGVPCRLILPEAKHDRRRVAPLAGCSPHCRVPAGQ